MAASKRDGTRAPHRRWPRTSVHRGRKKKGKKGFIVETHRICDTDRVASRGRKRRWEKDGGSLGWFRALGAWWEHTHLRRWETCEGVDGASVEDESTTRKERERAQARKRKRCGVEQGAPASRRWKARGWRWAGRVHVVGEVDGGRKEKATDARVRWKEERTCPSDLPMGKVPRHDVHDRPTHIAWAQKARDRRRPSFEMTWRTRIDAQGCVQHGSISSLSSVDVPRRRGVSARCKHCVVASPFSTSIATRPCFPRPIGPFRCSRPPHPTRHARRARAYLDTPFPTSPSNAPLHVAAVFPSNPSHHPPSLPLVSPPARSPRLSVARHTATAPGHGLELSDGLSPGKVAPLHVARETCATCRPPSPRAFSHVAGAPGAVRRGVKSVVERGKTPANAERRRRTDAGGKRREEGRT